MVSLAITKPNRTVSNMTTAIEKLSKHIKIDVDSMEPAVAKALPIKAWDMTSNQLLVNEQMTTPYNREMLERVVRDHHDEDWSTILDYVTAELAAQVKPHIQGRVLAQTSPHNAYDAEKIAAHARSYKKAYASVGITPDEFCIKVPVTGAGMVAAKQLGEEGIRTLGTSLFSPHQAIAASQAGCLSISPYFNEVRAHAEVDMWPNSDDPATKHPMSYRMIHIAETYKRLEKETGKTQPMIKSASFISAAEALAMPELGAHHATISQQVLQELTKSDADLSAPRPAHPDLQAPPSERMLKLTKADPLALAEKEFKMASTDIDYLADGGKALDEANKADEVTRLRLHDALELFKGGENRSKAVVEQVLEQIKLGGKSNGLSAGPQGIKV